MKQQKIRAKNDEGYSVWSEPINYITKADVPKAPTNLRFKIQQTLIKIAWDYPTLDGGDKITTFTLELSEYPDIEFSSIYHDNKTEYQIQKKLKPGVIYYVRVFCSNSIGKSKVIFKFYFILVKGKNTLKNVKITIY